MGTFMGFVCFEKLYVELVVVGLCWLVSWAIKTRIALSEARSAIKFPRVADCPRCGYTAAGERSSKVWDVGKG